MTAEEIFKSSVAVMNRLLTSQGMVKAIKRIKDRGEAENRDLVERQRIAVNEMVRRIAESNGSADALAGASEELVDAVVIRYLRNREIFLKTFPDGIADVQADDLALWAAMMISPLDEDPGESADSTEY